MELFQAPPALPIMIASIAALQAHEHAGANQEAGDEWGENSINARGNHFRDRTSSGDHDAAVRIRFDIVLWADRAMFGDMSLSNFWCSLRAAAPSASPPGEGTQSEHS